MDSDSRIDLEFDMVHAFLIGIPDEVLDISYAGDERSLVVQLVLLEGYTLGDSYRRRIEDSLKGCELKIIKRWISKEAFNHDVEADEISHYQRIGYCFFVRNGVMDGD